MPLRDGSVSPRRRRRRRRRGRGGRTVARLETARNVFAGAAIVTQGLIGLGRMLNTEQKFRDLSFLYTPGTTLLKQSLCKIPVGTGASDRIGNQIKVVTVHSRFYGAIDQQASNTTVRIMLVVDTQTNGIIFDDGDLLQSAAAQQNLVSPINMGEIYRFKIVSDQTYQLSIDGNQTFRGTISYHQPVMIRYTGAGGDNAAINTNNIYLVLVSDEAANQPLIQTWTRMLYVDN